MTNIIATIDFETYSAAGYDFDLVGLKVVGKGLPAVGLPVYAEHPTAAVLCLCYSLYGGPVKTWKPGDPNPEDLLKHVREGGEVHGWNVTFEFYIWNLVLAPQYIGWPSLRIEQCYCDMAKSRRSSLPGSLDMAAEVLGGAAKDKAGKNLIQKLTRPHTPARTRSGIRRTPETDPADFAALYKYCAQDVIAEMTTTAHIPALSWEERATWLADQRVNARGVQVDAEALEAGLDIMEQVRKRFTEELQQITGGAVASVGSVAQFTKWLGTCGVHTDTIAAPRVLELLAGELPDPVRRALEIRQQLGGANIKKLIKLKAQLSRDGRLRNQYTYCGADRTGRWSSGGVQLQNITSKSIAGEVEDAITDIKTRDLDLVTAKWGNPNALLAGCLRGLFIAKPGHELVCCDFSAIEAVVLACLARCQWRIDVFNTHGKIYEMSAAKISGVPFAEFEKYHKEHGAHHPLRKGIGKVAELASGYGGWINAWKAFGADEHFANDDEMKAAILAWRAASPEIVEFWGGQHQQTGAMPWDSVPGLFGLEGAAVRALSTPGALVKCNSIEYRVEEGGALVCYLPSGRKLRYQDAQLTDGVDHFRRPCKRISFMGYNSNPTKGRIGWVRMETYGGRLVENVTQAVAADIQAEALKRCEASGIPIVMHTHDELTAEVPVGTLAVAKMEKVMAAAPRWARGWPIRAAGWSAMRYRKD